MAKELLLEIGTEEIPAEFFPKALTDMEALIGKEFAANRIAHGEIRTMATPRRLVLIVDGVAEKQEDQIIEKIGPAKRVSFDQDGNPTKAALGFAKGQGIDFSEIEIIATEKGEYICSKKKIAGEQTAGILPELLSRFILSIPFKKSMRWMDLNMRFARPIHWILALFGGEVLNIRLENMESGQKSCGHRFMSPGFFLIKDGKDYLLKMRENYVVINQDERKK
jgi:glycyl-tRNA synthetase beta chain